MMYRTFWTHAGLLSLIFGIAALVNSASYLLSGISPAYNQSSDATVHVVQWQEYATDYTGNFSQDVMFQNYQAQPTGTLFVDKMLVRASEFLHIGVLDWSIIISALSLILFLSGVYFLVLYSTKKPFLAFLLSVVSIVPVISLGLSGWGFLVAGFVPKETGLGITVWLTILYLRGVSTGSKKDIGLFFVLLGLFANWYPPMFYHYALAILTAEVLRVRAIRAEHILYGVLFLIASPVALYDIFVKAGHFAPPVLAIIINHYGVPLHSLSYLLLHYLRKQFIYAALIGVLWQVYRKVYRRDSTPLMTAWYAIWWSTLVWSLIGVGIEVFAPLYMKYLISRISVWFYLASMVLIAMSAYELWTLRFGRAVRATSLFCVILVVVLLAQTSILNVYHGFRDAEISGADYAQYLSIVTKLNSLVPTGTLVLANPDGEANTVRAYGGVGTYVAAKDGNVTLFDGTAATAWFDRYSEARGVFMTHDFATIATYARTHGLIYYLFDRRDITKGGDLLTAHTVLQSGNYGLAYLGSR
jgi:hypothetical protein